MAGGGDHSATRRPSSWVEQQRLRTHSGYQRLGTRKSGCCALARYLEQLWVQVPGPSWGSSADLIPASNPCPPFPNDKATREFCFRRAPGVPEGVAKEGALRAGLCCRRGGALSILLIHSSVSLRSLPRRAWYSSPSRVWSHRSRGRVPRHA